MNQLQEEAYAVPPALRVKRGSRDPLKKSNLSLLLMCLPALALITIFRILPAFGIVLAFKDFNVSKGVFGSKWIGIENFKFFFQSMDVWVILRNTLVMNTLFIVVGTVSAIFVALLLNEIRSKRALKAYQTIMFFPYFMSWVVVAYLVFSFLSQDFGIFNVLLQKLGRDPVMWYTEPRYWPFILVFVSVWKGVGYNSIIYYTSLLSIEQDYFDAAAIDGASKLQTIRSISLPFLKPLIVIMTILAVGGIMYSDFGLFFQVTRNQGPLYPVTDVIDTYVYRSLLVTGNIGISSAVNFIQSIVGFLLVIGTNLIVRKVDSDSALF